MPQFLLHAFLQVLDGVLTYIGVNSFNCGILIEGNPILKFLMYKLGVANALILVKGTAIFITFYLKSIANDLVMLKRLLGIINLIYLTVCGTWIYILFKWDIL
jgi:hypothetical protein